MENNSRLKHVLPDGGLEAIADGTGLYVSEWKLGNFEYARRAESREAGFFDRGDGGSVTHSDPNPMNAQLAHVETIYKVIRSECGVDPFVRAMTNFDHNILAAFDNFVYLLANDLGISSRTIAHLLQIRDERFVSDGATRAYNRLRSDSRMYDQIDRIRRKIESIGVKRENLQILTVKDFENQLADLQGKLEADRLREYLKRSGSIQNAMSGMGVSREGLEDLCLKRGCSRELRRLLDFSAHKAPVVNPIPRAIPASMPKRLYGESTARLRSKILDAVSATGSIEGAAQVMHYTIPQLIWVAKKFSFADELRHLLNHGS